MLIPVVVEAGYVDPIAIALVTVPLIAAIPADREIRSLSEQAQERKAEQNALQSR